jgi:hypothetical protein
MHPIAEAEYRSWNTGKSFNRCLDEIYEEEMIQKAKYAEAEMAEMRALLEAEMREYEKEARDKNDF